MEETWVMGIPRRSIKLAYVVSGVVTLTP